jgi:hypothetical protein
MSQRLALIISAALTAFVLVLAGAVFGKYSRSDSAAATAAPDAAAATAAPEAVAATAAPEAAATDPTAAPPEAQLYLQREAAYRDLVSQANQRLQEAYAQLQSQSAAQSAAPAAVLITPQELAAIVAQVAPGLNLQGQPQLTTYQGKAAYQLVLGTGVLIIDAQTGQILYNGLGVLNAATSSHGGGGSLRADNNPGKSGRSEAEHSEGGAGGGEGGGGGGGEGEGGDH